MAVGHRVSTGDVLLFSTTSTADLGVIDVLARTLTKQGKIIEKIMNVIRLGQVQLFTTCRSTGRKLGHRAVKASEEESDTAGSDRLHDIRLTFYCSIEQRAQGKQAEFQRQHR